MMKIRLRAALVIALFPTFVLAADRTIDLSGGCKVYKLSRKKWVPVDGAKLDGQTVTDAQVLRNESFTVIKLGSGTIGINQKCLKEADAAPTGPRRQTEAAPLRGDTHSPWSAVFSLGYNLAPKGKIKTDYNGATETDEEKFKEAISFLGEANYRVNARFRLAGELGISQLATSSFQGNETSFFDVRPEFVFPAGPKWELYIGPMIGLLFMSQNTETREFTSGPAAGTKIDVKSQTASSLLLGLGLGADRVLNNQFDLGFFVRYFKPGDLTVTGTESFPTPGNTYSSKLTVSYVTAGLRFAIHF
ncbi:MAG: outer membrane beta-barrel protein [Bdellovibrionales bacterium]|nr:outer membrane beta-barrel protein [Bdellovibrionales bacterium]